MPDTITQAIRPYLTHCGNAEGAAERNAWNADSRGSDLAWDCAVRHARLAAKRARVALHASPVEPVLDPSWVGTVNMDAGFDPAQRRAALADATLLVCRHMDHLRMRDRADERAHATALAFALML